VARERKLIKSTIKKCKKKRKKERPATNWAEEGIKNKKEKKGGKHTVKN